VIKNNIAILNCPIQKNQFKAELENAEERKR